MSSISDVKCKLASLSQIFSLEYQDQDQEDNAVPVSYKGSQVWRTAVGTDDDIQMFKQLTANKDISLWNSDGLYVDYLVRDKDKVKVYHELQARSLDYQVLMYDVQRRIDATNIKPEQWTDKSLRIGHRLNWKNYPSLEIIEEYFNFLQNNFDTTTIKNIGTTAENRTIKMIKISNGNPTNQAILITAGQHAREWISVTSALYIASDIITNFEDQPDFIQNKDWYIIPVLNPDGYQYSQTRDRLWRKNRRKNGQNLSCSGVDINRNFPKHWQLPGVTEHNSCEEDYAGPHPFSELETLALRKLVEKLNSVKPLTAYFDLHSYGQMILYPWAGKHSASSHKTNLHHNGDIMRGEIYNLTRRKYTTGSPGSLLYLASGVAIDWVHSKGVSLCYAIETRDKGNHGFLLPAFHIEDTGKELAAAVKRVAKNIVPLERDGGEGWYY